MSVDHLAGGPCPKDDHCRIGTFAGRGIAGSYNQLATRSVAITNSSPCSTACSIRAMTLRWSADHGKWNVKEKYASQKNRKSTAAVAFRSGSTTSGSSPISRPFKATAALRAPLAP